MPLSGQMEKDVQHSIDMCREKLLDYGELQLASASPEVQAALSAARRDPSKLHVSAYFSR